MSLSPPLTKWIKVSENWYPAFPPLEYGNPLDHTAVRVRLYESTEQGSLVCAWGCDDFGLEIFGLSPESAHTIFNQIGDFTTQDDLASFGMHPA